MSIWHLNRLKPVLKYLFVVSKFEIRMGFAVRCFSLSFYLGMARGSHFQLPLSFISSLLHHFPTLNAPTKKPYSPPMIETCIIKKKPITAAVLKVEERYEGSCQRNKARR